MRQDARPGRVPGEGRGGKDAPLMGPEEMAEAMVPLRAEQALLGACLEDFGLAQEYVHIVTAAEFGDKRNRRIWSVMEGHVARGERIDLSLLMHSLGGLDGVKAVGGVEYLDGLYDASGGSHMAAQYSQIVSRYALLRRFADMTAKLSRMPDATVQAAGKVISDEAVADMISGAEGMLYSLTTARAEETGSMACDLVDEWAAGVEKFLAGEGSEAEGVPTGITLYTNMIRGLKKPDMHLLAGRPGMGKTSLMLSVAAHVAFTENEPVIIFSMEMNRMQVLYKVAQFLCNASRDALRMGKASPDEWERIRETMNALRACPLYIDDRAGATPGYIRSQVMRFQSRVGRPVAMVGVDYVQLMEPDSRDKGGNRTIELTETSKSLKRMAKELGTAMVLVAQVGKQVDSRDDKRPRLSDIRECDQFAADCDTVSFVYRERYYALKESGVDFKEDDPTEEECELIVAKNRYGAAGMVKVGFTPLYSKFSDLPEGFMPGFSGPTPF